MSKKAPPPCYPSCAERSRDCHARCERYIQWKAEHEASKAENDARAAHNAMFAEYHKTFKHRWQNQTGQKRG